VKKASYISDFVKSGRSYPASAMELAFHMAAISWHSSFSRNTKHEEREGRAALELCHSLDKEASKSKAVGKRR